ncbi:MAG: penicillin-binding protein 1A [Armatimonadota bacterium]|nr:penicillin-binding protein 1A [Armatimonadota bacterium]
MKRSGRSSRRRPRRGARWLVVGSAALAALSVAFLGAVAALLLAARTALPDVSVLYHPPSQATRIYAANGELIASLYRENRVYVPLSAIPRILQQAVIAIEDERFYQHRGVDVIGVMRALWVNLTRNRILEGGSTITQQLARTLFLTPERTLTRKLHEMLLALEMERHLTKEEILERYLNQVYFGNGAYGVEMAAQVYFNRRVGELGLPEASLLAGLIQAPSRYDPFRNFPAAKRRQEQVLRKMVELGFLSAEQAQAALRAPVGLRRTPVNAGLVGIRAPYFVSYLIPFLVQRYGEERVYRGGLRVYTTLDVRLQELAQRVIAQGIAEARASGVSQGALVAVDPHTGHIKAMVGGVDFHRSQFNRAWQALRQPGSAFKPFVYVAALERGASPEDILLDEPVRYHIPGFGEWQPKNYDRTYWGPLTLRRAVEHSRNVPAVRVLAELGPQAVIETARRMGIHSPLQPNLSLALGTLEVTVLEMASAYATLAANGVHTEPVAITRVTDATGRVLDEFSPERRIALRPEVAYTMTDILRGVILRGTGRAADIGRPAAGKTGTTDDYRNAWFVGYTPDLAVAVWVGNDDNTPMRRVVGGTVPARLWARFMREALANRPPVDFARPEGTPPAPSAIPGEPGHPGRTGPEERLEHTVKLDLPAAGALVSSPFEVAGRTTPGSRVRVVVTLEGGATPVPVRDEWLLAGPDGTFRLTVESPLRFLGARYAIVVIAYSPGGAQARTRVAVTER